MANSRYAAARMYDFSCVQAQLEHLMRLYLYILLPHLFHVFMFLLRRASKRQSSLLQLVLSIVYSL